MKHISRTELLDMMDQSTHGAIEAVIKRYEPEYLVIYENQQMDSSAFGHRQLLTVGPNNTRKTLDDAKHHLGDPPSQRMYPTHYCTL